VVSSLVCNSFRTYLGGEGRHASRSVPWLEWEAPVIRARTHAHTHTHRYKVLEVACTRTHTQIHSAKNDNHAYTDTQCWMWHACMHTQIHSAGSGMHARTQIHSAELANTLYLYVQTHSHQYTYTLTVARISFTPEPYSYTVYDGIFGDCPVKNYICTVYIRVLANPRHTVLAS
jgi:hypothetical protein